MNLQAFKRELLNRRSAFNRARNEALDRSDLRRVDFLGGRIAELEYVLVDHLRCSFEEIHNECQG